MKLEVQGTSHTLPFELLPRPTRLLRWLSCLIHRIPSFQWLLLVSHELVRDSRRWLHLKERLGELLVTIRLGLFLKLGVLRAWLAPQGIVAYMADDVADGTRNDPLDGLLEAAARVDSVASACSLAICCFGVARGAKVCESKILVSLG